MSEVPVPLEELQSLENIELIEEMDLRAGVLMSVGAQESVETAEKIFSVLPDGLEPVVDRVIRRASMYEDYSGDDTLMFEDYMTKDKTVQKWIIRFADGSYELTDDGIMEYMRMADDTSPLNSQILDTIQMRLNQDLPD